ncbi:MAG: CDP-diacylglycerol--serine O-phosphatidyltransferase [Verrucomicrobiia bacterium]|jgi:CDP-diacylglycerol--serine O-phosphatidyltransferase
MEDDNNNSETEQDKLRIYLLPNLFTGGNLFCGFLAITKIVEADLVAPFPAIKQALFLILLACILDLLDGRVARLGGYESPFGREFDSLADIVSFGVAPAFLVHRVVLRDVFANVPQLGWFIASVYLICGAFRLARFNCLADMPKEKDDNAFLGFPIPAAAGMVASLTWLLMSWDEKDFTQGSWRYILPVILLMLSFMMVSEVEYPSFKKITWKTRHPFRKMVLVMLVFAFVLLQWEILLPVLAPLFFTAYLIYGFVRKRISAQMRRDLENAGEE